MAPTTDPGPRSDRSFPTVTVVTGLGFELVAELGAFTSGPARTALDAGKTWVRDVRRRAGRELLRQVARFDFGLYLQLAVVALASEPPRGVADLLRTLEAMDPSALQRLLLGGDSPAIQSMLSPEALDRAIAGDAAARAELRAQFGGDRRGRDLLSRVLETPASTTHAELVGIARGWAWRVFPASANAAAGAIERDAAITRDALGRDSPAAVITRATNGIEYHPPPWTREVVLVPALALRPFVVSAESGGTTVFIYPVADEALDMVAGAPPRRLVKLAAALGDELRLRILQLLADDALSAAEIAERLGVERTTIHHHLGILRSAGLLTLRDERERGWHYVRRPEGLAIVAELEAFVAAPGGRAAAPAASGARRARNRTA